MQQVDMVRTYKLVFSCGFYYFLFLFIFCLKWAKTAIGCWKKSTVSKSEDILYKMCPSMQYT